MNREKTQQIINEVINDLHARIGGKAARKQYAPAKHQIEALTELGILDLMPVKFGHADAKAVIEEAQRGTTAVMNAYGEGETIGASKLYEAIHEVESKPQSKVWYSLYVELGAWWCNAEYRFQTKAEAESFLAKMNRVTFSEIVEEQGEMPDAKRFSELYDSSDYRHIGGKEQVRYFASKLNLATVPYDMFIANDGATWLHDRYGWYIQA